MTPETADREIWKTAALLIAICLHNLVYPVSQTGLAGAGAFYVFYGALYVAAAWLLSENPLLRKSALAAGIAVFVAGIANSALPSSASALAVFSTSIAYHLVAVIVFTGYISSASKVFTEVVLAAASLYLVIGSGFAALYGLVAWFDPAAFVAAGEPVTSWQQLLYFSYVTLTSVGYGDILPVNYYAQSLSVFEAIVGVLYTVILLSRLVGMHTRHRS